MANHERFLIGLAAPTNAGKTTLVNELQDRLGNELSVVNFDDYDDYAQGSDLMNQELLNPRITNWEDPRLFDYPRYLMDLALLKDGMPTMINSLSRENQGTGIKQVAPSTFTIVEGIFVLTYTAARQLFDLKYYLDLPEDEMVRRRLERTKSHEMPWDKVEYIKGPMIEGTRDYVLLQKKYADKVLDAMLPTKELADQILVDFKNLQQNP